MTTQERFKELKQEEEKKNQRQKVDAENHLNKEDDLMDQLRWATWELDSD